MKATELMIGDWILYGDKPVKVLQLSEKSKYDWVKPIPLSPEILEKNGFNRHGCVSKNKQYQVMIQHWSKDNLALNKVGKHGNPVFIPDLIYVHELQHALRLCGLNDLVDNFQI